MPTEYREDNLCLVQGLKHLTAAVCAAIGAEHRYIRPCKMHTMVETVGFASRHLCHPWGFTLTRQGERVGEIGVGYDEWQDFAEDKRVSIVLLDHDDYEAVRGVLKHGEEAGLVFCDLDITLEYKPAVRLSDVFDKGVWEDPPERLSWQMSARQKAYLLGIGMGLLWGAIIAYLMGYI